VTWRVHDGAFPGERSEEGESDARACDGCCVVRWQCKSRMGEARSALIRRWVLNAR
jgi:hypothetical protein